MSGKLVLGALRHAWQVLENAGVKTAVMGGLALARWKRRRLTDDVDLLIAVEPPATDDVVRLMYDAGFHPHRFPPVIRIEDQRFVRFSYTPPGRFENIDVDLLFAESAFLRAALDRAGPLTSPEDEIDIRVVSCEDLLLLKLRADRLIDRIDAVSLLQLNRDALDFNYLATWLADLDLTREWAETWAQAFPGEAPPSVTTASSLPPATP